MDDIHNDFSLTINLHFHYVIRQIGGDSGRTFVHKPMVHPKLLKAYNTRDLALYDGRYATPYICIIQ